MAHGNRKPHKKRRVRRIDVLYLTHHEAVEEEIKRLKEEEGKTAPKFELRTTASKNIIENMTEEELKYLDGKVEEIRVKGYPEEYKRMLVFIHNSSFVIHTFWNGYRCRSRSKPVPVPDPVPKTI
jgi:hypothetical protein